jgi:hypothetical protein
VPTIAANANPEDLEEYQRQLRDKEAKLTDIRLEALATAHQLDQTKDENLKMRTEMKQLKSENTRLQQFFATLQQQQQQQKIIQNQQTQISAAANPSSVSSASPASSVNSSSSNNSMMHNTSNISKNNLSLSIHNVDNLLPSSSSSCSSASVSCSLLKSPNLPPSTPATHHMYTPNSSSFLNQSMQELAGGNLNLTDTGKKVPVSVYLGDAENPLDDPNSTEYQVCIGSVSVGTRTKWDLLDSSVRRQFKEYLNRLDEVTVESGGLGLSVESIEFYYVGDMYRPGSGDVVSAKLPDLLPYGYLVGDHTNIVLKLKDAAAQSHIDQLSYDTLVPKNVLQRYISLLNEHRNLLFCGPNGTNKSYVARKIGEYIVKRHQNMTNSRQADEQQSLVYFNVENRTSGELKQFLSQLILSENTKKETLSSPPIVLIVDNLHNISNISDAFADYFSSSNSTKKW